VLLLVMLFYYHVAFGPHMIYVIPFLALACVSALAAGLILSATNVAYRDVRTAVPFLVQLWMFATPIAYPSSLIREPWRTFYGVNPMVGVAEGFRWALLGTTRPSASLLAVSSSAACVWLVISAFYFRRTEKRFADVI
jgi:homopolymeric O-antigen transport system permease protein